MRNVDKIGPGSEHDDGEELCDGVCTRLIRKYDEHELRSLLHT